MVSPFGAHANMLRLDIERLTHFSQKSSFIFHSDSSKVTQGETYSIVISGFASNPS